MISFKRDTTVLLLNLLALVAVVGLVFAGKVTGVQALGFLGGLILPTALTTRGRKPSEDSAAKPSEDTAAKPSEDTAMKTPVVASIPVHVEAASAEPTKPDEPS